MGTPWTADCARPLQATGCVQTTGHAKTTEYAVLTLEDETGIVNLVVWPNVFETHRPIVLSAGIIAIRGRIQREGKVVHLVAERPRDLSGALASVRRSRWVVPAAARAR